MRTLQVAGLALVAAFALSAIAAASASAAQYQLHSGNANTTITVASNATQEFTYETAGEVVKCSTVGGSGEVSEAQTTHEITFEPTYSGCSVNIPFTSVQVDLNECYYLFTIDPESKEVANGPVHIKCPTKGGVQQQIRITVKLFGGELCNFHIAEQTPNGVADYANNGVSQVDVTPTQTGIDGTRQGSTECGAAKSTSGTYTGRVQVKGEITGQQTATNIQVASAVAERHQMHSGATNTTITVSSNATQEFSYDASSEVIKCTGVGGSAEVSGKQTTTEVTFKPTYSNCTGGSFISAKIDMNECDYLFTIDAESKEVNNGPTHIKCPTVEGVQKEIVITIKLFGSLLCDTHIPEQTPSGVADYANNGTGKIDVTPTQTGIQAQRQGDPACGSATSTTGTYTGYVQVKGEITSQQTATNIQVG